jgi:hypothetical protein
VLLEMIVYSVHWWWHFLVCTYVLHFVCFGEETWNCMHFLVIPSLKTLWAGVKNCRTALHYFYAPRSRNLKVKVIQKCVHLKCICVWCLDDWSLILSGKPQGLVTIHINILSMHKHVQGRTPFLPPLTSKSCLFFKFLPIYSKRFGSTPKTLFF